MQYKAGFIRLNTRYVALQPSKNGFVVYQHGGFSPVR